VTGRFGLRFYAAVPLREPGGVALGTLALMDFAPRGFDEAQRHALAATVPEVIRRLTLAAIARRVQRDALPRDITENLTVCAWSKQVRIGDTWLSFDAFLSEVLGLDISHGLAPGVKPE
jgi:hypothetical protein